MFTRFAILTGLVGLAAPAHAAVLTVDCATGPYFTIQSAVLAAAAGDTIAVHPCTYNENVVVAGTDDIHLVAADNTAADVGSYATGVGALTSPGVIIDGTGLVGPCVSIAGSTSASIGGFRIQNCDVGVDIQQSMDTVVYGNRIQNQIYSGIVDGNNGGTVITGNVIGFSGDYGILIAGARETRVIDNWLANNGKDGIVLEFGDRPLLANNRIQGSGDVGIHGYAGISVRVERDDAVTSGADNLRMESSVGSADVVGTDTAGSLVDLAGSDLAENL